MQGSGTTGRDGSVDIYEMFCHAQAKQRKCSRLRYFCKSNVVDTPAIIVVEAIIEDQRCGCERHVGNKPNLGDVAIIQFTVGRQTFIQNLAIFQRQLQGCSLVVGV